MTLVEFFLADQKFSGGCKGQPQNVLSILQKFPTDDFEINEKLTKQLENGTYRRDFKGGC